ncbi:MAG: hypothetical protein WCL19_02655 [Verrucomicrobiota bacterium]
MNGSFHRRFWVLLFAAAAGTAVWKYTPTTDGDRIAFTAVARSFFNPPLVISGTGTQASPWALRAFSADSKPDPAQSPTVVSLGDDSERVFQSSPPAPIDLAVILSNLQRLGVKKAATAAVLAWETPDAVGLTAVEKSMARFDSWVAASPLSRSAAPSSMPPSFRRASIPLAEVHGDSSALPAVNHVPIPGVILGGQSALAGFSVLESESASRWYPLLARWEDRVVFAFPVMAVLEQLNLPVSGVEVRLGESLKLGPDGPMVAIDEFGRLAVPLKPIPARLEIPAAELIDAKGDRFPGLPTRPLILRDDQSAADPATRRFSQNLAAYIAAIASESGLTPASPYPRLPLAWEIGLLAIGVALLTALAGASDFLRRLSALLLAAAVFAAQWIAFGLASRWFPGPPLLAAILAALVIGELIGKKTPHNS